VYEAAQYEDATVPEPASRTALATARQFVEAPADTPVEGRTDGESAD
jgi:hypothetical protein